MNVELKNSLTKEFKELRDDLKEFRQDTVRVIETVMQQTTDLRQNLEMTRTHMDHLEVRVSELDDAENNLQKTAEFLRS